MLAYSSHLLQPLDVSCFAPLKQAYRREVLELARNYIFYVNKQDFLSIYRRIRPTVFIEQTIKSGFKATGLILYCPNHVLSLLTVTVRTLSPLAQAANNWVAETPYTVVQLQQQAQLICNRLSR
jgi:hypothetical protein